MRAPSVTVSLLSLWLAAGCTSWGSHSQGPSTLPAGASRYGVGVSLPFPVNFHGWYRYGVADALEAQVVVGTPVGFEGGLKLGLVGAGQAEGLALSVSARAGYHTAVVTGDGPGPLGLLDDYANVDAIVHIGLRDAGVAYYLAPRYSYRLRTDPTAKHGWGVTVGVAFGDAARRTFLELSVADAPTRTRGAVDEWTLVYLSIGNEWN